MPKKIRRTYITIKEGKVTVEGYRENVTVRGSETLTDVKYLSNVPVNESRAQKMTAEELAIYLDELVSKGHDIQVWEDI